MDSDLILVIGLVVTLSSIPSVLGATVGGRFPRFAAIMVMIGCGMMAVAAYNKPSGYGFHDIPKAITHVIGKYLN